MSPRPPPGVSSDAARPRRLYRSLRRSASRCASSRVATPTFGAFGLSARSCAPVPAREAPAPASAAISTAVRPVAAAAAVPAAAPPAAAAVPAAAAAVPAAAVVAAAAPAAGAAAAVLANAAARKGSNPLMMHRPKRPVTRAGISRDRERGRLYVLPARRQGASPPCPHQHQAACTAPPRRRG